MSAAASALRLLAPRTNNPPEVTSLNVQVDSATATTLVLRQGGASSPIQGTAYIFAYIVVP